MAEQGPDNINHQIQALETMIQQLSSEIISIAANLECEALKTVTKRFLQVLIQRAESKIRLLRESQN